MAAIKIRKEVKLKNLPLDARVAPPERVGRAKQHISGAPAHLPPITLEQRQPWMEKATMIATHIGAPKLAFKIANCIVRLGEPEVAKILEAVLLARKNTPNPAMSAVEMFFTLYAARRDALLSPSKMA